MARLHIIMILMIYMPSVLPLIRYDDLIYICWRIILPLVLRYLFMIFRIKFFIICYLIIRKLMEN
jgi:NADH:ubiquinone oxidoreductase subunit H